ncbi:dipeptidase [Dietzia aurantiaca]|uniref:dipeptidase n=1 Tax=Dietzia aurantiaca TaxID=983873 RepID=UPI001E3C5862|nr:dipeptidase [Dietzia aurantiaca]
MTILVMLGLVAALAQPGEAASRAAAPEPAATIDGMVDGHAHIAASVAFGGALRCGRPFASGGPSVALADCPQASGTGHMAILESILGGTQFPAGDQGYPTFENWPTPDSQLHEQAYYTGIERAWRAGLRVLNNHLVANRTLCELLLGSPYSCDEMDQLRRQVDFLDQMEAHIDSETGGPGQGWFRIARSPDDVRRITAEGKLAVTLGVEASEPFGCRVINDLPMCSETDIDHGLDEFASWGVSTVFLVHKFDNALGGTRMDPGLAGAAVNIGNKIGTQQFWKTEPCSPEESDNDQPLAHSGIADAVSTGSAGAPDGAVIPVYPAGPLCNVRGLTPLGEYAVHATMDRGMVINIDHMSHKAAVRTLDIAEEAGYAGLVTDHSWSNEAIIRRIHEAGGFVSGYAGLGFLPEWREVTAGATRPWQGFGYGSDVNGLAPLPDPRPDAEWDPLRYPFTAPNGAEMDRWVFGERIYDINRDGVAQYGLYADWIADLLHTAGPDREELRRQLMGGAEAWTATWESGRETPR